MLARSFLDRSGYVRVPNQERRTELGSAWYRRYKKGWEVRLLARTEEELGQLRRWLEEAGFRPGRPFPKGRQIAQPVYGREAVARFLALVERERAGRGPAG